jgi:hypothetical protein
MEIYYSTFFAFQNSVIYEYNGTYQEFEKLLKFGSGSSIEYIGVDWSSENKFFEKDKIYLISVVPKEGFFQLLIQNDNENPFKLTADHLPECAYGRSSNPEVQRMSTLEGQWEELRQLTIEDEPKGDGSFNDTVASMRKNNEQKSAPKLEASNYAYEVLHKNIIADHAADLFLSRIL